SAATKDLAGFVFTPAATLPAGSSQSQVRDMMKSMLFGRFGMKLHHESKDFPVYALVRGKGPLKLEESPLDPETGDGPKGTVNVAASGSRDGVSINMGRGAYFTFANDKLEARKLTAAAIAETLARFMDKPVVDQTGLTGTYNMTLNFTEEDYRAMLIRSAVNAGVSLPPQALRLMENASGDSLFSAIQEAGLKLEPRKAALDVLVIDSIARTPTEN
ncbi:MAG: TIGR03435 family protein, partial [Acidobacteriota bacterium]|nr:TIGR03435 family protein [Acidobacteriota bacterium]